MNFQDKLKALIELFEKWLSEPEDNVQIEQWLDAAESLAYSFEFTDVEQTYVDRIIEMYEEQFLASNYSEKKLQATKNIPSQRSS